jgi:hypothetical protein
MPCALPHIRFSALSLYITQSLVSTYHLAYEDALEVYRSQTSYATSVTASFLTDSTPYAFRNSLNGYSLETSKTLSLYFKRKFMTYLHFSSYL